MKKLVPIILIIIVLIIAAIFLFKGYEPRTKDDEALEVIEENLTEESSTTETSTESVDPTESYRNAFINANVAMTCYFYNQPDMKNNEPQIAISVDKVYSQYGLPVLNNSLMLKILKKYESNQEVTNIISQNASPCNNGAEGVYL